MQHHNRLATKYDNFLKNEYSHGKQEYELNTAE